MIDERFIADASAMSFPLTKQTDGSAHHLRHKLATDSISVSTRTQLNQDYSEISKLLQQLDEQTSRLKENTDRLLDLIPAQTKLASVLQEVVAQDAEQSEPTTTTNTEHITFDIDDVDQEGSTDF
jgi:Tfp pilus assembly protein PilO